MAEASRDSSWSGGQEQASGAIAPAASIPTPGADAPDTGYPAAAVAAMAPPSGAAAAPATGGPTPGVIFASGVRPPAVASAAVAPGVRGPAGGGSAPAVADPVEAAYLALAPTRPRIPGLLGTLVTPYSLAFLLLLIGAAYMATTYRIGPLAFNTQAFLNVTQVLAPLFLVSAFVERAVEVILTGLRGNEADRLGVEIDHATAAAQANPTPQTLEQVKALQHLLTAFKSASRGLAFLLSTGLGVGAALCGIRGLAGLLAPTQTPSPAFTTLDILLTGIVIGGGADGIHKIVQAVLDFVENIPSKNA